MSIIDIEVAREQLAQLVDRAANGEDIAIGRDGVAIARLSAVPSPRQRKLGALAGKLVIPHDFDAPLPDDILADFYGP